MTKLLPPVPISVVIDTIGHTIERFPENVLHITKGNGDRISPAEHASVADWYWTHVGVPDKQTDPNEGAQ